MALLRARTRINDEQRREAKKERIKNASLSNVTKKQRYFSTVNKERGNLSNRQNERNGTQRIIKSESKHLYDVINEMKCYKSHV